MMIGRESGHITLTQRDYILTLVERYGMAYSLLTMDTDRTVRSSLEWLDSAFLQYNDDAPCNKKEYQGLVGAFLYCSTGTRPDIVRSMSKSSVPTYGDWRKALRIQPCSAMQRSAALCSAVQRSAAQYSAVQRSAAQYSEVQRSAALCSAVQRYAAQCISMQRSAMQRSSVQRSTAQSSATLRSAAQCSSVQRSSVAHYSAVQSSKAQYSAV
jgi:hypothetical protein